MRGRGVIAANFSRSSRKRKTLPSSAIPGATRGQILAENNQVKKLIAAFSVRPGTPTVSEEQIAAGKMEVELVPEHRRHKAPFSEVAAPPTRQRVALVARRYSVF